MCGECSGVGVMPWVTLPVVADGHGGSAEQVTWWQRNIEIETTDYRAKQIEEGLWNSPVTPIGQGRSGEGEEGGGTNGAGELLIWGKLEEGGKEEGRGETRGRWYVSALCWYF